MTSKRSKSGHPSEILNDDDDVDDDELFCGRVELQKEFSLISSQDHCQRYSSSQISNMPRAGFEPIQNLSSGFVKWSYAVVITTTPWRHSQETTDSLRGFFLKLCFTKIILQANCWSIFILIQIEKTRCVKSKLSILNIWHCSPSMQ